MATTTWQQILERTQQTNAVWNQHAPTFTVRGLTLAQHQADADAMAPAAQAVAEAQDAVDDARAARDATAATINDLAVRLPRKLDGELLPDDPFHRDLEDIRNIPLDSTPNSLRRGQAVLSLWKKINARNAAATPVIPALTVGGAALAALQTPLEALPARTQTVQDKEAILRDRRSDLRTLSARADQNNKRWFAAWQGEFPAGTPEGDALGQITTEGGGSGAGSGGGSGGPAPGPTLPGAAEIIGIGVNGSGDVAFSMAAEGATSFDLWRKGPDDEEFALIATGFEGTSFVQPALPPGEYQFRAAGRNAAGVGPQSEPSTITVG